MPKKEKKQVTAEEPKKVLNADDLEKVVGGAKTIPDAEITPVEPKSEVLSAANPKKTASANGDITLPEIP